MTIKINYKRRNFFKSSLKALSIIFVPLTFVNDSGLKKYLKNKFKILKRKKFSKIWFITSNDS